MELDDHRQANLANWNERVAVHRDSQFYGTADFARDPKRISGVVALDAQRLAPHVGDIAGKTLLHLQCHFGMDSLSWARLGASVTGVDFSPLAVAAARQLSTDSGAPGRFVQAELYDAPRVLDEQFDVVYTGVGALCWLPDIRGWARVAAHFLAPGGTLYLREAHPVLWALGDERDDDLLVLHNPYFETAEPLRSVMPHTYTDGDAELTNQVTYEWNHGLGEVVQALLDAGLTLTSLHEHREVEWQALPFMVEGEGGRWRLPDRAARLPLMYSLTATAPSEPRSSA